MDAAGPNDRSGETANSSGLLPLDEEGLGSSAPRICGGPTTVVAGPRDPLGDSCIEGRELEMVTGLGLPTADSGLTKKLCAAAAGLLLDGTLLGDDGKAFGHEGMLKSGVWLGSQSMLGTIACIGDAGFMAPLRSKWKNFGCCP